MAAVLAHAPEKSHGRAAPRHFDALETDANANAPAKKKSSPASGHRLRDSDEGARKALFEIADFPNRSELSFHACLILICWFSGPPMKRSRSSHAVEAEQEVEEHDHDAPEHGSTSSSFRFEFAITV